jgi:hypothetical protein
MTSPAELQPSSRRIPAAAIAFAAATLLVGLLYAGGSVVPFVFHLSFDGIATLLWAGGCFGLGVLLWDAIVPKKVELPASLRIAGSFALGAGIFSTLVLLLGLVGVLNNLVSWVMIGAGLVVTLMQLLRWWKTPSTPRSIENRWWYLPLAVFAGIALVASFVPPGALWADQEPNGYDVVEYHFQVPREWYESRLIEPLQHNVYSYFPFGMEMHYLLAMHLNDGVYAGMYVAQLMHAVMIAMSVLAVHGVARSLGRSGLIAALAAGLTPWLLLLAPIGFNEGALLLYGVLSIGLLLRALHAQSFRVIALAGVMAGFACGVKLTAVPMVVLIPAIAAVIVRPRQFGFVALFCIVAAVTFSPWLIRNFVWVGNPVFPEAMNVLGHGHFSQDQVNRWELSHRPPPAQSTDAARVRAAVDQIILDWRFGYCLLPLALLAIVLRRSRDDVAILIMLLLMLGFWIGFTHLQGRFFVLAIPLMALAIAGLPWRVPVASLLILSGFAGWMRWQATYYRSDNPDVGTLARTTASGALGLQVLDDLKFVRDLPRDRTIVLVGDGNPFWFSSIPMKQLRYRTVFDIDARGRSAIESWCDWNEPLPGDAVIVVDPGELLRLSNTYHTPAPDEEMLKEPVPFILKR